MKSGWQTLFERHGVGNALGFTQIDGFIEPKDVPEAPLRSFEQCGPPGCVVGSADNPCEVQVDFEDITVPEEFVIVLDKSGSMEDDVSIGFGSDGVSRLDFARAAARAVVRAFTGSTSPTRVGVVAFDHLATQVLAPTQVSPQGAASDPDAVLNAIDSITTNDGFTGIGLGLNAALQSLQTTSPGSKAILLLSDGQNNRPCECIVPEDRAAIGCPPPLPGEVCDFNQLPDQAATNVGLADVQLFTAPVGGGADRVAYALLADAGRGEMFDSVVEAEVIPNFMLAYIAFRGGQPILAKARSTVQREPPVVRPARQSQLEDTFELPVEAGAETLEVLISVHESRPGTWDPNFELVNPAGSVVVSPSVSAGLVTSDDFFRFIRVEGPAAGPWTLRLIAPETPGSVSSFVTAFVSNPNPDCLVGVSKRFVPEGESIQARVLTSFGIPLQGGIAIGGELVRPDGSRIPLSFSVNPLGDNPERFIADIPASLLAGRGTYSVEATCQVSGAAQAVPGEGDAEPNQVTVTPFQRTARTQFFANAANFFPPVDSDPDKDGISTDHEPEEDLDGDGVPCWLDTDCDGDEVPDSRDPDPTDPLVTGRECALIPQQVACCVNLATCDGRGEYVLYGSEQVRVRNDAIVSPDALIASSGELGVELAAGAQTGTIHSHGDVVLSSGASVLGDVLTGGLLLPQTGASVDGGCRRTSLCPFRT